MPRSAVVGIAREVAEAAPFEIAIADTIGVGVPGQVSEIFARVAEALPGVTLRGHFHNTRNTGIANAYAAAMAGAQVLDASLGGLGGCPFAPAATGNIPTEDLVYMLGRMGIETGIDLHARDRYGALGRAARGPPGAGLAGQGRPVSRGTAGGKLRSPTEGTRP